MASLRIRKATVDDEPSLSRICLLTAEAGKSAEARHDFKELPGLVYSVPYVKLPTTWAFVLEEEETKEVVGYVVGSTDTRAYEQYASEHWWPALATKYPVENATQPGDVHYSKLLRAMHTAPDANIAFSRAHLHINLLDTHQRKGWGRKLIATAVEHLQGVDGLDAVWIGMDPRNHEAGKFYRKVGFKEIEGADANQLGLRFVDFAGKNAP